MIDTEKLRTMMHQSLVEALEQPKEFDPGSEFTRLLGAIELLFCVHQHNHWESQGPSSYSDHLLFERLYTTAREDMDKLAERSVGLFGVDSVRYLKVHQQLMELTMERGAPVFNGEIIARAIALESKVLEIVNALIDSLVSKKEMTHGLEDLLPEIASHREEALYLLNQRTN
jgi:DNA-binding ferritin-like protein